MAAAPAVKSTSASIRARLRPSASLRAPPQADPPMAPTMAELTIRPCVWLSLQAGCTSVSKANGEDSTRCTWLGVA